MAMNHVQSEGVDVSEVLVADELEGTLCIPPRATGLVLFAHGSGSSRFSSRNRYVADQLQQAGLATLLFDLLTPRENQLDQLTREYRFNIDLLASRLTDACDWARRNESRTQELRIGLFGASTGAAAALRTAAERPYLVDAVVSRGGRPDLAGDGLPRVQAPTLLLVGEDDTDVLGLNRAAAAKMTTPPTIEVVPGASHLFEEPGALEHVAEAAARFLARYLST